MAIEMSNKGEVVCKIFLDIKSITYNHESDEIVLKKGKGKGDEDSKRLLNLVSHLVRISNNAVGENKAASNTTRLKLNEGLFDVTIKSDQYFGLLCHYDESRDLPDSLKFEVCDELEKLFLIIQVCANELNKNNPMLDNSVCEGAGENCVHDIFKSLQILHMLSGGEKFLVKIEGHNDIELHIKDVPPGPLNRSSKDLIALESFRIEGLSYREKSVSVTPKDAKQVTKIIFEQSEFFHFYDKYLSQPPGENLLFDFVVKVAVGNKVDLVSYSGPQNLNLDLR